MTKGERRKTDLKKMEDKNKRMVTFTKRRGTLFGKACKLCVSCGAEIGIIAYSPNGNPFVFDSSSVLVRFLGPNPTSGVLPSEMENSSSESSRVISYDNRQLMKAKYVQWEREALSKLDTAQKEAAAATAGAGANEGKPQSWWWEEDEDPGEDVEEDELEFCIEQLEKLGDMVKRRAQQILQNAVETTSDKAGVPMTACSDVVPYDGTVEDPTAAMTVFDASNSAKDGIGNVVSYDHNVEDSMVSMTKFDASSAAKDGIGKEVTFDANNAAKDGIALASDDYNSLSEYEFDFDFDFGDIPLWS